MFKREQKMLNCSLFSYFFEKINYLYKKEKIIYINIINKSFKNLQIKKKVCIFA